MKQNHNTLNKIHMLANIKLRNPTNNPTTQQPTNPITQQPIKQSKMQRSANFADTAVLAPNCTDQLTESKQIVPYVRYVKPLRFKYCDDYSKALPFGWVAFSTPIQQTVFDISFYKLKGKHTLAQTSTNQPGGANNNQPTNQPTCKALKESEQ